MFTTFGLGLIYLNFYDGGDTWNFHRQAILVLNGLEWDIGLWMKFLFMSDLPLDLQMELGLGSQPRAMLFVKLIATFHLLTGSSYWLTSLYLSLTAYYSGWLLLAVLIRVDEKMKLAAVISLLFLPTVVFWSSGIIKESIAQSLIYVVVALWLDWTFSKNVKAGQFVVALCSLALLFFLKYYYAVVLGVVLISATFTMFAVRTGSRQKSVLIYFIALFIFLIGGTSLHPNLNLDSFWTIIVDNYFIFESKSSPQNIIHFQDLNYSFGSFFLNMPIASLSGLFRPLIFEGGNLLKVLAGIENSILLILGIGSVYQLFQKRWKMKDPLVILSALVFVVVMATFLAFAAPNLGTLSRYRIGFLPILWILMIASNPIMSRIEKRVFLWLNIE